VINYVEWNSTQAIVQSILACAILALLIFAPAYWTLFLRWNITKFRKSYFIEKYGSIIENLNFKEKSCSNYIAVFCYRRLM
jgi:hypothetical protein